jgi:hypothetical protein
MYCVANVARDYYRTGSRTDSTLDMAGRYRFIVQLMAQYTVPENLVYKSRRLTGLLQTQDE